MWDKSGQSTDNGFNIVTSNWDDPPSMHVASNDHKKKQLSQLAIYSPFFWTRISDLISLSDLVRLLLTIAKSQSLIAKLNFPMMSAALPGPVPVAYTTGGEMT